MIHTDDQIERAERAAVERPPVPIAATSTIRMHAATFEPSEPPPRPDFPLPVELVQPRLDLLGWMPKPFRQLDLAGPNLARFVRGGEERVRAAREAFAEAARRGRRAPLGNVVLRGPAGSGKTAIACAWLRGRILAGIQRARFVPELKLGASRDMGDGRAVSWEDLAMSAHELVLDDLGARVAGAPEAGGLAAQRIEAATRVVHERYDRGQTHVVTTPHDRAALTRIYGDGVARRVYEGAAVVDLGRVGS